jgi:hypothetical protein
MTAKILPFRSKADQEKLEQFQAVEDMVADLKSMFTDEQIDQIKLDLDSEEETEITLDNG